MNPLELLKGVIALLEGSGGQQEQQGQMPDQQYQDYVARNDADLIDVYAMMGGDHSHQPRDMGQTDIKTSVNNPQTGSGWGEHVFADQGRNDAMLNRAFPPQQAKQSANAVNRALAAAGGGFDLGRLKGSAQKVNRALAGRPQRPQQPSSNSVMLAPGNSVELAPGQVQQDEQSRMEDIARKLIGDWHNNNQVSLAPQNGNNDVSLVPGQPRNQHKGQGGFSNLVARHPQLRNSFRHKDLAHNVGANRGGLLSRLLNFDLFQDEEDTQYQDYAIDKNAMAARQQQMEAEKQQRIQQNPQWAPGASQKNRLANPFMQSTLATNHLLSLKDIGKNLGIQKNLAESGADINDMRDQNIQEHRDRLQHKDIEESLLGAAGVNIEYDPKMERERKLRMDGKNWTRLQNEHAPVINNWRQQQAAEKMDTLHPSEMQAFLQKLQQENAARQQFKKNWELGYWT